VKEIFGIGSICENVREIARIVSANGKGSESEILPANANVKSAKSGRGI
jgi:hypothetical protein